MVDLFIICLVRRSCVCSHFVNEVRSRESLLSMPVASEQYNRKPNQSMYTILFSKIRFAKIVMSVDGLVERIFRKWNKIYINGCIWETSKIRKSKLIMPE